MNESIKVLIVDDDLNFRSAQRRNLRRMQLRPGATIEVLEAESGNEAMELAAAHQPDCILIDNNMPGGTGISWMQRILNHNSDTAIIMLTGQGSEQLAVEAMKNGALDYLVKGSISPEDLERVILNALDKIDLRRTIDQQREKLIEADRQRVMIESLGTACHHIGQPATVISAYLQLMLTKETDEELKAMITTCMEASDAMGEILQQLQRVSQYSTTPYLPGAGADTEAGRDAIISLD